MPLLTVQDIEKMAPVFRGKFGNKLAELLRKALAVDKVSDINDEISDQKGADFARAFLDYTGVRYQIGNPGNLYSLPDGPFITVSNHPYGGLDGIILLDLMGHMRDGFKMMVNQILALIDSLAPSLIVVNPKTEVSGGITPVNLKGVRDVFQTLMEGNPVGIFPSGAVSDLKLKKLTIEDREWQPSVLKIIQKAKVPVVPVRFFDHNSFFFYNLGLIDWRVRVMQLPKEVINKKGKKIRVGIGKSISVQEQLLHKSLDDFGALLRNSVYGMTMPEDFVRNRDFFSV